LALKERKLNFILVIITRTLLKGMNK
jgi:hypothetical protein